MLHSSLAGLFIAKAKIARGYMFRRPICRRYELIRGKDFGYSLSFNVEDIINVGQQASKVTS